MTPEFASATLEMLLPGLRQEVQTTRRVLGAVPDDQAGYKPHETNMSALELVQHIASSEVWFLDSIVKGEFLDPSDSEFAKLGSPSKMTEAYEQRMTALLEDLAKLPGEHLAQQTKVWVFDMPILGYVNFMMCHTIHHRGQLSVYLRPMGSKVPSIYGGSADEPFEAAQTA